jgi:hypothetical protein
MTGMGYKRWIRSSCGLGVKTGNILEFYFLAEPFLGLNIKQVDSFLLKCQMKDFAG